MWYTSDTIIRILSDMISESLDQPISNPLSKELILTQDVGLNSMQILELSIKVNTFFQLHNSDKPPYLLNLRKIGDWVERISIALEQPQEKIGFTTSGTGGKRKLVQKATSDLYEEVAFLQKIIPTSNAVLSLVPSQNIYGFLFTVLLPEKLQIPSVVFNDTLEDDIIANALIIATPFHWQYLYEVYRNKDIKLKGVSSGAPMDKVLHTKLLSCSWVVMDVYGSTETGGIGYRLDSLNSFELFPYFNFNKVKNPVRFINKNQRIINLSDSINITGERHFLVDGRIDGGVQIAGVNIQTKDIEILIRSIDEVSNAFVYAKGVSGNTVLFCTITLHNNTKESKNKCVSVMKGLLTATQFPSKIIFNEATE